MKYDNSLSLKENYMCFYQDCLGEVGIRHNTARLACAAYVELSPDDELEKQRIYLRDNGIKHCKWVLSQWDRVFLHWKDTGSLTGIITVMDDTKHKTRCLRYNESFIKDDEDPTVIGYEYDPGAVLLCKYIDTAPVIKPKDEIQPQPIPSSATEAPKPPVIQPQPSQQPQPESQSAEEVLSHRDPNRLDVEMCDELRQYLERTATKGVYNTGPVNPLYNLELAKSLMNVYEGSDPLTNFEKFMSNVY